MPDITENLCGKLSDILNSTNIFYKDNAEKPNYGFICALNDRVSNSMEYILKHPECPNNINDFLLYMVHACIVRQSVKDVLDMLHLNYDELVKDLPNFLSSVCTEEPFKIPYNNVPTDDAIFEYVRSLSFAHPLKTNRAKFLQHNETQCSPFLILGNQYSVEYKDYIGIHIYSNNIDMASNVWVPFPYLQAYVQSRYNLIKYIIEELEKRLQNKEKIWKTRKVNRDLEPVQVLSDIKSILEERYISTYHKTDLLSFFTCNISKPENKPHIQNIQQLIIQQIPNISNAVDNLDYEQLGDICGKFIFARPKHMHEGANYQLEKIFSYLNEDNYPSDKEWGLLQAKYFAQEFAKKWVIIDPYNMSFEEIKLLTMVACFLEKQEQDSQTANKD